MSEYARFPIDDPCQNANVDNYYDLTDCALGSRAIFRGNRIKIELDRHSTPKMFPARDTHPAKLRT